MDHNSPSLSAASTAGSDMAPQFNDSEKKTLNNSFEQLLNNVNADEKQIENLTTPRPSSQGVAQLNSSLVLEDENTDSSNAGDIRKMVDPNIKNQIRNSSPSDKKNFSLENLLQQGSASQKANPQDPLQFQVIKPNRSQNAANSGPAQSS